MASSSSDTSSKTSSNTSSDALEQLMNQVKLDIAQIVKDAVDPDNTFDFSAEQLLTSVQRPKKASDGDLSVPLQCVKRCCRSIQCNFNALAKDTAAAFKATEFLSTCKAIGQFLVFTISPIALLKATLESVFEKRTNFGATDQGKGQKVVVEFSSPNIAKPFHAGHLRSTIIGNFLVKLHQKLGFETVAINYLGDWGKQYGLLAVAFEMFGDEEKLQANPIEHLYEIYVKVNQHAGKPDDDGNTSDEYKKIHDAARKHFALMEQGDADALALWKKFRDLSIAKYKETYDRLGVHFDEYSGESFYSIQKLQAVLKSINEAKLAKEDEGALIVDLKKHKCGVVPVQKSDGTALYITRDIAAAIDRAERIKFDKMIYVVASPQNLHFRQFFKILELLGYDWVKKCKHVNFGLVNGMSTRNGTAVFLDDILEEAKSSNLELMKENPEKLALVKDPETTASVLGASAVFIQDMRAKRIKSYDFDWKRCLSSTGATGVYLQYAHVRIASIMRKVDIEVTKDVDFSLLKEPICAQMANFIATYPRALQTSLAGCEPSTIVSFALELARMISVGLTQLQVKGVEENLSKARLLLFWCAQQTLKNSMSLLGLDPLERM
mmetsp:Transcript_1739/g.2426  ORF Transcript_1739/g.2426 Transcript_1739/m.2426 type:complete len:609 (-) Transcript_1739:38-1864(-)|eukprot:CAMPEP_0201552252 /NCGR_PEP_ID=MMETSP0173_2-20130828/14580_1 /ASSEMBLY_ACC=CAM_ASM_000268 /TAXON_ID=218659 /ORGANISM="Vexillifera sp., Strain DIVA3 564/2" /LENGTH=608 /DNA_ID=CAMNT_0047962697 /DNA_START=68 /DNA_END=1894 /DNA_ORIENTATION=-